MATDPKRVETPAPQIAVEATIDHSKYQLAGAVVANR